MKSKLTFLLFFSCFLNLSLSAQNAHKYCGHDKVMEKARQDNPNFDREYETFLDQALLPENLVRQNDSIYTIEVVFHILYKNGDDYQNVSDELIQSQLDAMNRDFNMRNADTTDTRPIFKDLAANARIEFVLAKRLRPNGNCFNPIIRKTYNAPQTFIPIFLDFLVKEDFSGGSAAWNTKKYLNIWVLDLNVGSGAGDGFLGGYAYFPDMTPVKYNGVVLDYRFFGQDNPYIADVLPSFSRFSKGRACVHEIGHWLGLRHVWGDLGTLDPELGCTADDGIDDTPNAATAYSANGLCSDTIVNSCLDQPVDFPDMFENYMDYSSDDCQSLFTAQQVAVMRSSIVNLRSQLLSEVTANTTEVINKQITENNSAEICFESESCLGFGEISTSFCSGGSSYNSSKGNAGFVNGENCINYNALAYNSTDFIDSFCLVVYDSLYREYDTTIIIVEIVEQCPKVDTIQLTIVENSSETICLEADPCLAGSSFTLSFCGINNNYSSDLLNGSIDNSCIDFDANDYDANNFIETVCVIANHDTTADTTYIEVSISPATGIDVLSSKENFIDVYPNPTNGQFTVLSQTKTNEDIKVSIFNTIGDLLSISTIKANEQKVNFDISSFAKGIYILSFETNEQISFEKITLK